MSTLFRKYRPQRFADVAEQEHVVRTLTAQIVRKQLAQVYLFCGPRGVGKTTIARLLAKSLQCTGRDAESFEACGTCFSCTAYAQGTMLDTLEIDAASQTGVDAVRENILDGVRFAPSLGKYKVFIIDEVHMLSSASFNALLKTLEEPPAFAVFILATTELHKIPATVLSRCQRFSFTRIPVPAMLARLADLVLREQRVVAPDVLLHIARLSEGCLRDAESLLGQVLDGVEGDVTSESAQMILPQSSVALLCELFELLAKKQVTDAAVRVKRASEEGFSLRHVHEDFLAFVQEAVFVTLGGPASGAYDDGVLAQMRTCGNVLGAGALVALLDALLAARGRMAPPLLPELPLQLAFFSWEPPISSVVSNTHIKQDVEIPAISTDQGSFKSVMPDSRRPEDSEGIRHPEHLESDGLRVGACNDVITTLPVKDIPVSSLDTRELENSIREKWGRCLEKAKSTGAGYALMVGNAVFAGYENPTTLRIEFPYQMHADRMQDVKNAKVLLDAISDICMLPSGMTLHCVRAARVEEEAKEGVEDLLDAFGGSVVT